MTIDLPDPRVRAVAQPGQRTRAIIALVEQRLAQSATEAAAADDRAIDREITALLADTSGMPLHALFDAAPSVAIYRHLWRRVTQVMGVPMARADEGLALSLFAIPVVIVAGSEGSDAHAPLAATLDDVAGLADLLREHGALGGSRTFALADALVGAATIDIAQWPRLRAACANAVASAFAPLDLQPSPIDVGKLETVHLRYVVGSALSAAGAGLFDANDVGAWGMPLAKALAARLATVGATVLALPRTPAPLPQALLAGKLAQREVSAQVFVTNALRKMRASVGEPTAIVSAHRLDDGAGELRLSLSSPFLPRDAEGFRCPLFAFERVGDAAQMLDDLLRDCRVADVRVQPGIHADRDGESGVTLLFKPPSLDVEMPRRLN